MNNLSSFRQTIWPWRTMLQNYILSVDFANASLHPKKKEVIQKSSSSSDNIDVKKDDQLFCQICYRSVKKNKRKYSGIQILLKL